MMPSGTIHLTVNIKIVVKIVNDCPSTSRDHLPNQQT